VAVRRRGLLLAVLAACLPVAAAGRTADISQAETLLFLDDHFTAVRPPTRLRYSFRETLQGAPERTSELDLALAAKAGGGCCAVSAEEKGGPAFAVLPSVDEAKANPVILYFLERDIRQMQGLTGGQSGYFRRLIRLSLAEDAKLGDTTVRYRGRELPAREIEVQPYRDDPRRDQYAPLAAKTYRFVLARDVPGGIYQLRTLVPGETAGAPALAQTTLTQAEE
jgi:hypothetical protein